MSGEPGDLPVEVARGDEAEAWATAVVGHFHEGRLDERTRRALFTVPAERRYVVHDRDRIVANAGVLSLELGVGGRASLPCAGVTTVGVAQTHRRRGLLRALMRRILDDARERDEPVAALYASESAIYPRFGFGPSAPLSLVRLERAHARFTDPVDPRLVTHVEPTEVVDAFPEVLERARRRRAGVMTRTRQMWGVWAEHGDVEEDDHAGPRRLVAVPGRGYAAYRVKAAWTDGLPDGQVKVSELVALDPEAEQALWQHVTDVDLTTRVEVAMRPDDDPLPQMLMDPLRARAVPVSPLYTCLLDVSRCLASRTASADGRVRLGLVDPFGDQSGTLRVQAEGGVIDCAWVGDDPDVSLPTPALAALWLGGHTATRLADARRIEEHEPGSLRRLDSMLATERRPWTPFEF